MKRAASLLFLIAVASCGQRLLPAGPQSASATAVKPATCYLTTIKPTPTKATITFYGWPDNTPPGNAIAHPVIHKVASGDGTYCNPTTFATEKSNNSTIPYGTKIYVPFLKQYFVREDLCAASGPPVGSGYNGCYKLWFDLWIGGDGKSNTHAVVRRANLSRRPAPNGTCFGKSAAADSSFR